MSEKFTLISHHLCPYVQRVAIALTERNVEYSRIYIDLNDKPEWFNTISPLGKVPVLQVEEAGSAVNLFESAVILEYLEEIMPVKLHPVEAVQRALHRAWIEFGSSLLDAISRLYSAPDRISFLAACEQIASKFRRVENQLQGDGYFAGTNFTLVDAVFGPVFRYFDVIDATQTCELFSRLPKTWAWRQLIMQRASVRHAVSHDYNELLYRFLLSRESYLGALMRLESGRAESVACK